MQYQIRGFNVRGSCLIRENHEHLYPRNIPAIRYVDTATYMHVQHACIENYTNLYLIDWLACDTIIIFKQLIFN